MKYDLRNEQYVRSFCEANGVDENIGTEKELAALDKFLDQFDNLPIALILAEQFNYGIDTEDNPSRSDLINAINDAYILEKEVDEEFAFEYFLDEIITFIIDEFEAYGLDYPDELLG